MRTGDNVYFRKNKSFISRSIAFFTSSSYTHQGKIYEIFENEIIVYEAQAKGFYPVSYPIAEFMDKVESMEFVVKKPIKKYSWTDEQMQDSLDSRKGTPYGYFDIAVIALNKITGKILFPTSGKKAICSEECAYQDFLFSNGSVDLRKEYNYPDFSLVTPDDSYNSKSFKRSL